MAGDWVGPLADEWGSRWVDQWAWCLLGDASVAPLESRAQTSAVWMVAQWDFR